MSPTLRCVAFDLEAEEQPPVEPESVDVIVTSPPYKTRDGYSETAMLHLGMLAEYALRPGGRLWLNFGQLREDMARPFKARGLVEEGGDALAERGTNLHPGPTIAWVKSIAIDGVQKGHYQPLNTNKVFNYAWEPIFTFYKLPERDFDRLAIGVPFADKSNMRRGGRGANGDLHCAGDAWFVPYSTTGASKKKATATSKHAYEWPEALVERMILASNLPPGSVVLDPFCGSGTTGAVAKRLGHHAILMDRDPNAVMALWARWDAA